MLDLIRREAIAPDEFAWSMPLMLFFAIIVGIGQIIFAYNLFDTLNKKYKFLSKQNTIFYVAITSTAIAGISHILIVSLFMGFESKPSLFLLLSGINSNLLDFTFSKEMGTILVSIWWLRDDFSYIFVY